MIDGTKTCLWKFTRYCNNALHNFMQHQYVSGLYRYPFPGMDIHNRSTPGIYFFTRIRTEQKYRCMEAHRYIFDACTRFPPRSRASPWTSNTGCTPEPRRRSITELQTNKSRNCLLDIQPSCLFGKRIKSDTRNTQNKSSCLQHQCLKFLKPV